MQAKVKLTVEACIHPTATASKTTIVSDAVLPFLSSLPRINPTPGLIPFNPLEWPILASYISYLNFSDTPSNHINNNNNNSQQTSSSSSSPSYYWSWQVEWEVLCYQLNELGGIPDDEDMGDDNGGDTPAFKSWNLPCREMEGMWETLWYDHSIKHTLLSYSLSALQLSDAGVDPHAVNWSRSILLHGPPGTGKTTLCKALAQKLSIQMSKRYKRGRLVEVSAHSLFSKWFSESGKLVAKLFSRIEESVEESNTLVFVLIDEVESLTSARKAAAAGSEPSDAIRAVNALLTQMDALRRHPNVLILTTSNVTEAIDDAFIDRADIKAYIGPPGVQARYEILRHALHALQSATIIQSQVEIPPFNLINSKSLNHHHGNGNGGDYIKANYNGRNSDGGGGGKEEEEEEEGGGGGAPVPPTNLLHSLELGHHHQAGDGVLVNTAPSSPSSFMTTNAPPPQETPDSVGRLLFGIVKKESDGFNGRTLRKLPFLAHVVGNFHPDGKCTTMTVFLAALSLAAQKEQADRESLVHSSDGGGVKKDDKIGGGDINDNGGDHDMGRKNSSDSGSDSRGGGCRSSRSSSQGGRSQPPPPSAWKTLARSIQSL